MYRRSSLSSLSRPAPEGVPPALISQIARRRRNPPPRQGGIAHGDHPPNGGQTSWHVPGGSAGAHWLLGVIH